MTEAGWEQRLENLARAQERADGLREAIAAWFFGRFSSVAHPEAQEQDRQQAETDADALLSGPLAPLLEAQAAVGRCGVESPEFGIGSTSICALPAGHAGWHREGSTEWGKRQPFDGGPS